MRHFSFHDSCDKDDRFEATADSIAEARRSFAADRKRARDVVKFSGSRCPQYTDAGW